jgi:hypothetical protein
MICAINPFSMAHQRRKRFAPLLLVLLVKNQWRIGVRHCGFSNGAPMAQWRTKGVGIEALCHHYIADAVRRLTGGRP